MSVADRMFVFDMSIFKTLRGGGLDPEETLKPYFYRPFPYAEMFDEQYNDKPHPKDDEWQSKYDTVDV